MSAKSSLSSGPGHIAPDAVEEASMDSFPASDPPAWIAGPANTAKPARPDQPHPSELQEVESVLRELEKRSEEYGDLGWLYERLDAARSCLIRGMPGEYRAQLEFSQATVSGVKDSTLRRSVAATIAHLLDRSKSGS